MYTYINIYIYIYTRVERALRARIGPRALVGPPLGSPMGPPLGSPLGPPLGPLLGSGGALRRLWALCGSCGDWALQGP